MVMSRITTIEQLEAIYSGIAEASTAKVADRITPEYRQLIEGSPFVALATSGPEGLDCSPRGDLAGFVRIHDEQTLMMPDRRGNNRVDSLRNIIRDPRIALLFLIPGLTTTFRVNGRAFLDTDQGLLDSFIVDGKAPRSVIVVEVEEALFPVRPRADPLRVVESGEAPLAQGVSIAGTDPGRAQRGSCGRRDL